MFSDILKEKYYKKLNSDGKDRGDSFLKTFQLLESEFEPPYQILETGTTRASSSLRIQNPDLDSHGRKDSFIDRWRMSWEGCSTVLFDEFVNFYDGSVTSVDINKANCEYADSITSEKTQVINSDSVKFLWDNDFSGTCLFYLDSFDVDLERPIVSNFHHMKELTCISGYLSDCLLVVDDCKFPQGEEYGKGYMVRCFMENIGADIIYDGYQNVWRVR
tara:strand:+ start:101 stop:754 length:654 start_codon:yes stop_codon:yes gene_type:complete